MPGAVTVEKVGPVETDGADRAAALIAELL